MRRRSPLHTAVAAGHVALARLLLRNFASAEASEGVGCVFVYVCVWVGSRKGGRVGSAWRASLVASRCSAAAVVPCCSCRCGVDSTAHDRVSRCLRQASHLRLQSPSITAPGKGAERSPLAGRSAGGACASLVPDRGQQRPLRSRDELASQRHGGLQGGRGGADPLLSRRRAAALALRAMVGGLPGNVDSAEMRDLNDTPPETVSGAQGPWLVRG